MRYVLNLFLLFSFCLFACSPSVQYMGRSYPPTNNVDIYFNATDVKKSYEVMGKVDGKAWELSNYSKIQESIVAEAKKKGADGVIFTGMGNKSLAPQKTAQLRPPEDLLRVRPAIAIMGRPRLPDGMLPLRPIPPPVSKQKKSLEPILSNTIKPFIPALFIPDQKLLKIMAGRVV